MNNRNKNITIFSYPSYRKLKKELGVYDAVLECTELAIREFNFQYESTNPSDDYLERMSRKHSINVNIHDWKKIQSRTARLYIVSAQREFENFLTDFKEEFKNFRDNAWVPREEGETLLETCMKNVFEDSGGYEFVEGILNTYNYYRLIRNRISHGYISKDKIQNEYAKYLLNKENILSEFNLQAGLNEYENISYDDFILFSNIVKHIGYVLSTNGKPEVDTIAELIKNKNYKSLKKVIDRPDRFANVLRNTYHTYYGRISPDDFEILNRKTKSLLA